MKLSILLFASLKTKVGSDRLALELPGDSASVEEVLAAAIIAKPQLEASLRTTIVAINKEFASKDQVIVAEDEVAFFPPVSGG